MIGLGLGIANALHVSGTVEWVVGNLFLSDQAGYCSGSATPLPFEPSQLFGTATAGHAAGSYAPAPFTPSLLFGTATAGHLSGGYEVTT